MAKCGRPWINGSIPEAMAHSSGEQIHRCEIRLAEYLEKSCKLFIEGVMGAKQTTIRATAVGIFVLVGLLCVGYLAIKLGRMELFSSDGFTVSARFDSATGLRPGADVEMAGVPIGRVTGIRLDADPMHTQAVVEMRLNENPHLSDDSMASIKTSGLIGDKYVSLTRGGSDTEIKAGGSITETESPMDLESLIGKYAFGGVK